MKYLISFYPQLISAIIALFYYSHSLTLNPIWGVYREFKRYSFQLFRDVPVLVEFGSLIPCSIWPKSSFGIWVISRLLFHFDREYFFPIQCGLFIDLKIKGERYSVPAIFWEYILVLRVLLSFCISWEAVCYVFPGLFKLAEGDETVLRAKQLPAI